MRERTAVNKSKELNSRAFFCPIFSATKPELPNAVEEIENMFISLAVLPPNLTNMTKITYLQALIDSSMPAELEKCNETPKKCAWTLNFAH